MRHKPKLAIISSRYPYPLEKGDKLRLYHQIKELSTAFHVYLIALTTRELTDSDLDQLTEYCREVHYVQLSRLRRYIGAAKALLTGKPLQVGYYVDRRSLAEVHTLLGRINPDRLYCQLARVATYAVHYRGKKVIDYMDAFAVGMRRRADVVRWWRSLVYRLEASRMSQFERQIYKAFDGHTVISEQDAAALNLGDITVISNGIDTRYFSPIFDKDKKYDIGFIGNMGYLPNVAAAEFLVNEIVSGLECTTVIAGARPDPRVLNLVGDSVHVTGWVDDIRDAYAEVRLFVAPLYNGTGQQNKILEAMAMGIPVVTTPAVNHAIGAVDGREVLLAKSASEFRSAITRLIDDRTMADKISAAARTMVINKYSWQQQTAPLIDLLLEE